MSGISSTSQDNFDKSRTMMDNIGEHCTVCNQLDFLPFTCQWCHLSFCSNHRELYNEHMCSGKSKAQLKKKPVVNTAREKVVWPSDVDRSVKPNAPNTILSSLESKSLNEDNLAKSLLLKLKLFLHKNKLTMTKKKNVFSSSSTQKIIEISNLKKTAVGDAKIPVSERLYIKVQYVPEIQQVTNKDKTISLYVSRSWPIGRLLDQASFHLKIVNVNNKTTDEQQRLTIFRAPRVLESVKDPIYIPAQSRVMKEIQDGDTVYLVRGANV